MISHFFKKYNCLVLLISLFASIPAMSQEMEEGKVHIYGKVVRAYNNAPIDCAKVEMIDRDSIIHTTYSEQNGMFNIWNLESESDSLLVVISAENYVSDSTFIRPIINDRYHHDVELKSLISTVDMIHINEWHLKRRRQEIFWSLGGEGFYFGVSNSIELTNYWLGGELKYYGAFYGHPLFSVGAYANYRHLMYEYEGIYPRSCIGAGIQVSILGLETNFYFDEDRFVWGLMPKVGIDFGSLSFFYGFSFPLINKYDYGLSKFHNISLKYFFFKNRY